MGKTAIPYDEQIARAAHHVRAGGELKTLARVVRDCAPNCERPQRVVTEGRPYSHLKQDKVLLVDLMVPCRKCAKCLATRAREWTRRAFVETTTRPRTWFGTFTMDPYIHSLAMMRVRQRNANWAEMTKEQRFAALVREASPELTRYLKRVRKRSGAPLRYLLVAEEHSQQLAGLPHFHILIHEMDADTPVRKSILKGEWKLGFSRWKLADQWSARYVCKYLAKEASTRVRASRDYGRGDDRSAVDRLSGRRLIGLREMVVIKKPTNDP